jgi:hypothetical protein
MGDNLVNEGQQKKGNYTNSFINEHGWVGKEEQAPHNCV